MPPLLAPALLLLLLTLGCAQTSHPVAPSALGAPETWGTFESQLPAPGPVRLTRVLAADWEVSLSGLLNLDHDHARTAGLEDRPEPIQIYFYVLEHPTRGTFLVDTGVARSVAQRSDDMPVGWIVQQAMDFDALHVHVDTATWLERSRTRLRGVLLTHLHLDHILGLQDLPKTVPIYVGPGEAQQSRFLHLFTSSTTADNLDGFGPLREFAVAAPVAAPFGVVDLFGDDSVYGLHIPGHTAGSMAYVVRTPEGPHLIAGDGCHTAWGWEHAVEPGTFNADPELAAQSFQKLRAFAQAHPEMRVHLGHQELTSRPGPPPLAPR
jgi:glyoxylase-like metal-dependent hydrolase (beta-lactamase superfamily II)